MRRLRLGTLFQSTLSLRRATGCGSAADAGRLPISIHALLAESDEPLWEQYKRIINFNPRSPCGERPGEVDMGQNPIRFQSTLSLRRATSKGVFQGLRTGYFNPRSPCGERPDDFPVEYPVDEISIHALLAESDATYSKFAIAPGNFNPRSPCGERLLLIVFGLSIPKFQSTLSLRRATADIAPVLGCDPQFQSTLSLRRATPT